MSTATEKTGSSARPPDAEVLDRAADAASGPRRIRLQPAATAMAWLGPERSHEALAVLEVSLAPGDALVEVEIATICGADSRALTGNLRVPVPTVLGQEAVGRVVEVGERTRAADGTPLRIGDRVVWSAATSCRRCDRCRRGLPQRCRQARRYGQARVEAGWELCGAFATHVHLKAGTAVVRVSEALPAVSLAPVSGGVARAVAAIDAAGDTVDLDDAVVLVTGAGFTGLAAAALAAEHGARVIVADPDASRRALAQRFGADRVIEPTRAARKRAVAERGADLDVVVETTGGHSSIADVLGRTAIGGVTVLAESVEDGDPSPFDAAHLVQTLGTLRGVDAYAPHHLVEAVAFVQRQWRRLPFAELVGETVPLARLDEGLALAASGRHIRVAVAPRA